MKRNRLSILLILVMFYPLIFSCFNGCYHDTMGMNEYASRGNEGGDTEDSPDDQLDHTGVTALLKASFLFPEGYFLRFLSAFSFCALLILFTTSILRC